jgi:hypothetical protein
MGIAFDQSGSLAAPLADRPAPDPNKIGRFFLETETGQLYRDCGTLWLPVRDALPDSPRTAALSIQVNNDHALQVCAPGTAAVFDEELTDPGNLFSDYENILGVTAANSDNGTLYFRSKNGEMANDWYFEIYADANYTALVGHSMVPFNSVIADNNSGLSGTLTNAGWADNFASAHWLLPPNVPGIEIFNVNTLTGVVTLPAGTAEPPISNPDVAGKVLTSTPEGVRSWIAQNTGSGGARARFKVWRTTNFSFSDQTNVTLPFDTIIHNTDSLWNPATHEWSPPAGSTVILHGQIRVIGAGYFIPGIFKNGQNLSMTLLDSGTGPLTVTAIDLVASGDKYSFVVWKWNGGTIEANNVNCMNFFEGIAI